jgi:hypothetical protein
MRLNTLKKTLVGQRRGLARSEDREAIAFRTSLLALNAAVEAACRKGLDGGGDVSPLRMLPVRAAVPVEGNKKGI